MRWTKCALNCRPEPGPSSHTIQAAAQFSRAEGLGCLRMTVASLSSETQRHRVTVLNGEPWAAAGCPRVLCVQGIWCRCPFSRPSVTVRGLLISGLCCRLSALHWGLAIPMPPVPPRSALAPGLPARHGGPGCVSRRFALCEIRQKLGLNDTPHGLPVAPGNPFARSSSRSSSPLELGQSYNCQDFQRERAVTVPFHDGSALIPLIERVKVSTHQSAAAHFVPSDCMGRVAILFDPRHTLPMPA